MNRRLKQLALAACLALVPTAPNAAAQAPGITVARRGPQVNASFQFGTRRGRHYDRRPGYPVRDERGRRGHWRIVEEKVWVAARHEKIWIDAVYETYYDDCGRARQVLVRPGYWNTVRRPGYWTIRQRKVWEPEQRYGICPVGTGSRSGRGYGYR